MSFVIQPVPDPRTIPELKPLFDHESDQEFMDQLLYSLNIANKKAKEGGLDKKLYQALPLEGMNGRWPTTFEEYTNYLAIYSRWVPHQSVNPVWINPTSSVPGEHQEVYDYLCWFYWLIDQDLGDGKKIQNIPWFADFLVGWARLWGDFLDTTDSFSQEILDVWRKESPKYRIEDSMIPDERNTGELRPNAPSGWLTFNQFFARELNGGLRPIAYPDDNRVITSPADCTYKMRYDIDEDSNISPPITIKGTHTYANVKTLLAGSQYADCFAGGNFVHSFLGPYSYHRFHTPVAGIVKECYPVAGQVYLQVSLEGEQFSAADSADDGYEFLQARGILTIDTTGSPYGDIGIVAVLPIGMCQVSGVNMTHQEGAPCQKGDEFGYFTFGGSDIIVLTQKGTDPVYNPAFVEGTEFYSLYGSPFADVKKLRD
ncbi:MAG: phosphatidylserine decarboxylase [Pseudomonadota bacterium]